jgi:hypothetical protein
MGTKLFSMEIKLTDFKAHHTSALYLLSDLAQELLGFVF